MMIIGGVLLFMLLYPEKYRDNGCPRNKDRNITLFWVILIVLLISVVQMTAENWVSV